MKIATLISTKIILLILLLIAVQSSFAQLQFIENKGQWNKEVDYKSDIQNGSIFLQRNGFMVLQHSAKDMEALTEQMHGSDNAGAAVNLQSRTQPGTTNNKPITIHSHAYKVNFVKASGNVELQPDKALPTYNNYFIGNDSSKWKGFCKIYQGVTYKNIYPNIDVRYYTDQGTLKYDLIVNPGGNINDIALQFEGVDNLSIKNKELIIGTSLGEMKELYHIPIR